MSFARRFLSYPSRAQIQAIEGVVVVDQTPLGQVQGVGTGVAAVIAEFQDCSFAGTWDKSLGKFNTAPKSVQIFGSADQRIKTGGFDETIGDTGNSGGSGWVDLFSKVFGALVVVPVNIASTYGLRVVRQLPTNASATNPTPAIPMAAGSVPAGTEFRSGSSRVRLAQAVGFTSEVAYGSGVDGTATSAGSAASHTFGSAGADFVGLGVKKGDIGVIGALSAGSGAQFANASTYRVVSVTDLHNIVVEKLDGTVFDWTTGTALAWRLHTGTTADSYGTGAAVADASQVSYLIAARPLDADIALNTVVTPTVAQPTPSATAWSPLSGLQARTGPNAVVYTSGVQAPNAIASAALDTLYQTALDSLLANSSPAKDVSIVASSRTTKAIRAALKTHCLSVAGTGRGRTAPTSPPLFATPSYESEGVVSTQSTSTIVSGSTPPAAGANRDERVDYAWPGLQVSVPDAVGFQMPTSDGGVTTDGILDVKSDVLLAAIMSNLPAEQNPAQETDAVAAITAAVLGFQRGAPSLSMSDYIALKAAGVAAPIQGANNAFFFQSGITTSQTSGQTDINRRRFADEVEDSLAAFLKPFAKRNLTEDLKDDEVAAVISYLDGLLSTNNPAAQRIAGYSVDDASGNTKDLLAAGIFTIIVAVQMLAEQKQIVLVCQVGPTVTITQKAA